MRVLIYTHAFAPKIGGVETVVMSLATGLAGFTNGQGATPVDVSVMTPTPRGTFDDESLPFRVVRQPSLLQKVRLMWGADVIHLAGPAFLPLLVALLLRKPVVVEHHGYQAICPNGQLLFEPAQKLCPGHFMAGRHVECLRCNAKAGLFHSLMMWLLTFPRRWLCARVASNITPTQWLSTLLRLPRMITFTDSGTFTRTSLVIQELKTSVVPMPKAMQPTAPKCGVCESEPTLSCPGNA